MAATTKPVASGKVTVPYAEPANPVEWAEDFLTYIGAPDPKESVAFITAAENVEGTFYPSPSFIPRAYGDDNRYNPLDSTQFEAGGVVWAENGGDPVWQFPTLEAGLASNAAILEGNPGDAILLKDLKQGTKTAQQMADDIAASDWGTGGGPGSAAEVGYSQTISGALQEALSQVDPGMRTPTTPATLTGWEPFPGGLWDPLNIATNVGGQIGSHALSGTEKTVVNIAKDLAPYFLEFIGVIFGVGLVVIGAYKAAGRKASEAPGVGALINVAQKAPEVIAA